MSLTTQKTAHITRTMADESGKPVVSMSGQVVPGKAMSLSMTIANEAAAKANGSDVAKALDAFVIDVRQMAKDNGLPV